MNQKAEPMEKVIKKFHSLYLHTEKMDISTQGSWELVQVVLPGRGEISSSESTKVFSQNLQ